MSESSHLAEAVEGLFAPETIFWFVSFPTATEGLTAEQAAYNQGPRINSIWGVTLHLTICQQFALAVLRGETIDVNAFFKDSAWPPLPEPRDEAAWQKARTCLLSVNHALSECIAGLSSEILEQQLPYVEMKGYQYIQGHLAHNSNHLCEIVSIRHMQGLWLENT